MGKDAKKSGGKAVATAAPATSAAKSTGAKKKKPSAEEIKKRMESLAESAGVTTGTGLKKTASRILRYGITMTTHSSTGLSGKAIMLKFKIHAWEAAALKEAELTKDLPADPPWYDKDSKENLCKVAGLVKNRRIEIVALRWSAVRVKLLREDAPDTFHVIARCRFSIAKKGRAVGIMRKQLPFTKAWALTINKSQGQTLDGLLLDATAPPFEHGHSYVAPTRVHGRSSFGAFVDKKSSCTLDCGRKCLVLPCITYDELLGPVRG